MRSRERGEGYWTVAAEWADGSDVIFFTLEGPPDGAGNDATEFVEWLRDEPPDETPRPPA